jgi:hypothetical protein
MQIAARALICFMCLTLVAVGRAETIRFLVGESIEVVHGDSYVLPLSDMADIAHARKLISMGSEAGSPIVVSHIAKGANGVNRNYLAAGAPKWSWHLTEFLGFYDFTAEIYDGWPTFIEDDVDGWIDNTDATIGFWQYTVIAELPQGDYDADLDVDTEDLQVWRASFGGTSDLSADGSGNGIVDIADYVVWRRNLGTSGTLPQTRRAVASVPEASTIHLAIFAASLLAFSNRRISVHHAAKDTWLLRVPLRAVHRAACFVPLLQLGRESSLPGR